MQITVPREIGMRLVRADQELSALQHEIKSYMGTIPYHAGIEHDPDHPERRRIVTHTKPLPVSIPIRISECVHHWRASLDNFAYLVSCRHSRHTPRSEFPIFLDPVRFSKDGIKKINGMKPAAQTVIERLQPYHGDGVRDPLWMLHELSNADKHRLMHSVGGVLEVASYEIAHLDPGVVVTNVKFFHRAVKDGSTVGYVSVEKHGDPAGTFTLTFTFTYDLVFESRVNDVGQPLPTNGRRINVTTILMRDAVWDAFWRLRRFAGRTEVDTNESAPLYLDDGGT
jgi:hypothetical protein